MLMRQMEEFGHYGSGGVLSLMQHSNGENILDTSSKTKLNNNSSSATGIKTTTYTVQDVLRHLRINAPWHMNLSDILIEISIPISS